MSDSENRHCRLLKTRQAVFLITLKLSLQQSTVKTVHTYGIYKKTLFYFI